MAKRKAATCTLRWRKCTVYFEKNGGAGRMEMLYDGSTRVFLADDMSKCNVQDTLLHELFEAVAADMGFRFENKDRRAKSNQDLLFHMTHSEFTEACSFVGPAFAACLPQVMAAWKKLKTRVK